MSAERTRIPAATYQASGVSIDAGNALVERIKPLAKATQRTGTMGSIGGFGALFDLKAAGFKDPILVSSTDGVGTKLKLATYIGRHDTIGVDLVAMCVNDLLAQGAQPLFFLDYFATGRLEVEMATQVISGIAEGCKQAGCALVGGETAEMPGMYQGSDYDLAGFAVGAVERGAILPSPDVAAGDIVLGLASSGVHSNGYSLVRHIVKQEKLDYAAPAPFDDSHTLGEALLTPTRIYVKSCLAAMQEEQTAMSPQSGAPCEEQSLRSGRNGIKALAHITGGGLLENIPRVLPKTLAVKLDRTSWKMPPVFTWLQRTGNIEEREMLRTFNCGIGMVLVVKREAAENITTILRRHGETVYRIGEIVPRTDEGVVWL